MTDTSQLVGTEISQLDAANTLDGSEVIPADQSGRTVRVTAQQIANLAGSTVVVGTGAVSTVNGQTGTVVLGPIDIGLGSVDNTSDQTKNTAIVQLSNKTLDGGQNTFQNIPQAAITGLPAALATVVNTAGTGLSLAGNTISLADTAVSPAQYGSVSTVNQITVDQQGRITNVNALTIAIPQSAVTGLTASLALGAPIASPTFTGVATAPAYALTGGTGAATAVRWVGGTTSAAPTSGTWLTGDGVIGTGGKVYICTAGGTPGTWVDAGSGSSGPPTGSAGGDLAGSGSTYPNPVIANGAVTLAKQANLPGLTIQGNNSGSAGVPVALNATQVKSLLAITEADVASLATDLANLAPIASPTFTGVATAPTMQGGAGPSDSLQLKASGAISPTGNIDMIGNAIPMLRLRAADGHFHVGTDVGNAGAPGATIANAQAMITARDRTITWNTWPLVAGTALMIGASTAEPHRVSVAPNTNGNGIMAVYDVDQGTGGTAAQHVSTFSLGRNFDNLYNGCVAAGQFFGYAFVNTSTGLHADACLPFGMDMKGRVANTITDASHPGITGLELGGSDDSQHRATNVGLGLRLTNQGANNLRNALLISNTTGQIGAWENGIVIATGQNSNLASVWTSGTVYNGGEMVADNLGGGFWLCKTAVTGTTRPSLDATHWVSIPNSQAQGWVTGRDHGIHTVVTSSGASWVCAVAHTNGTTNPNVDRWNGYNGVAGPDGLASATASAGHWIPWEDDKGVVPHWTNTSLTTSTKTPGYYHWIGPVTGSNMLANTPAGTPLFSIDTDANLTLAGNIGFNGKTTQALTGWVAPTGTVSRAAFDQSTVTLANLAQRVAALVTDLRANGVIG